MSTMPSISIVTATYNYGRYLPLAVESVFAQTFRDWELIIVDDGSTDGTPEIVERYLADPRVRCCRTDHVLQPGAKNLGVRLSRAPLVAFLDADDVWLPAKLEKQLALFERDPELGVAYSRRLAIDAEGRELPWSDPPLYRGDVLPAMFRGNFVCFSSSVVRRAVFERVGLFDEGLEIAIDYDLWLRAARCFRFDYVDEPLVRYRMGHANLSRRSEERLEVALGIMDRFLQDGSNRARLDRRWIRRCYAETHAHLALLRRDRSRLSALGCYLRALGFEPGSADVWKGLGGLFMPEWLRRALRRALGRPADWRRHPSGACPDT